MTHQATAGSRISAMMYLSPLWDRYLLWVILAVAALLRLWGIGFGLPYEGLTYNQVTFEESMEVHRAFKLGIGEYTWLFGKGGLYLLLFVEYGFFYVVSWLLGWVENPREFALQVVEDRTAVYMMGRVTVAAMGVLTCLVVYGIGKRLYDQRIALGAAFIGAMAYFHTVTSSVINVDIGMTLALWASVLVYLAYEESQKLRFLIGAGALGGVAVAFKLPGLLVLPMVLLAMMSVPGQLRQPSQLLKRYGVFVFAMFGTLTIIAPEWIPSLPGAVMGQFSGLFSSFFGAPQSLDGNAGGGLVDDIAAVTIYSGDTGGYIRRLTTGYNLALTVSALLGFAIGLWRRQRWDIIWGVVILAFVGVMSLTDRNSPERYLLPIVPALWLLGSRAVFALSNRRWWLAPAALAVVVSVPAIELARQAVERTYPDTRLVAKDWIETNVTSGEKILMDGMRYRFIQSPPLNPDERTLARQVADAGGEGESLGRGVSDMTLDIYREGMAGIEGPTYDLYSTSHGLDVNPLSYYVEQCFGYIVTSSYISRRYIPERQGLNFPESARFYEALNADPRFSLVYQAEPVPWKNSGPVISVYEVALPGACGQRNERP